MTRQASRSRIGHVPHEPHPAWDRSSLPDGFGDEPTLIHDRRTGRTMRPSQAARSRFRAHVVIGFAAVLIVLGALLVAHAIVVRVSTLSDAGTYAS